jgi:hypothetical protein
VRPRRCGRHSRMKFKRPLTSAILVSCRTSRPPAFLQSTGIGGRLRRRQCASDREARRVDAVSREARDAIGRNRRDYVFISRQVDAG